MPPEYRTFEQLQERLGADWTKGESEAPSGVCVILTRTWPCGCRWTQSLGVTVKSRLEWLFPCRGHADLGFHAEFRDEVWREQAALREATNRRKGKMVTPEMLNTLAAGDILRVRSLACAEEYPGNLTLGSWLWFVRPADATSGGRMLMESCPCGPISSAGPLVPDILATNEVRLVTRGEECWPTGPTWELRSLEPQAPPAG